MPSDLVANFDLGLLSKGDSLAAPLPSGPIQEIKSSTDPNLAADIDLSLLEKPSAVPRTATSGVIGKGGPLARGVRRGTEQSQGLYGQFIRELGDATGFASLVELGDELVQEAFVEAVSNPPEITDIEDLRWDNAGTWVLQNIGEQLPNIGLALGGALLGAATGGVTIPGTVAAAFAKAGIGKAASQAVAKKALMSRGARAAAGTFGAFLPLNTGEIIQEQRDAGLEPDLLSSLFPGTLSSGLEVLGFAGFAAPLFKGIGAETAAGAIRTVLGRLGHGSLQGIAAEGGTEAVQEAIVIASKKLKDPTFDIDEAILSSEGLKRIAFASAAGATVGGVFGGAGGLARGSIDATRSRFQLADLRAKTEPLLTSWENAAKENSFVDFETARKSIVSTVQGIYRKGSEAAKIVKDKIPGVTQPTQDAVVVASMAEIAEAEEAIVNEGQKLRKSEEFLERLKTNTTSTLLAIQNVLNEIPRVTEDRSKSANASVESFQKETKTLLDEFNALDGKPEEQVKLIPKMVQLAERMVKAGLQNAAAIKKSYVMDLTKAVAKATTEFAKAKQDQLGPYRKVLNSMLKGLDNLRAKLPEVETTPEQTETAEGRPEMPVEDTLNAMDEVAKGTKEAVFLEGHKRVPVAVGKRANKHNLVSHTTERGIVFTREGVDVNEAIAREFPNGLPEGPAVAVTVEGVTSEAVEATPEAVQEAVDRRTPQGKTKVESVAKAVGDQARRRIAEVREQLELGLKAYHEIRVYDQDGNLLETLNTVPADAVDDTIQELYDQNPGAFITSNNEVLHKTLLKTDKLYQQIWKDRKKILTGRPIVPLQSESPIVSWETERRRLMALKNWDPERYAQMALKNPTMEEQDRMFQEQLNAEMSGQAGLMGNQLFSKLVDKPLQMWGVSVDKNGNPSAALVEVQKTEAGWKTANGKDMYLFTKDDVAKLERKLNQEKKFNRYGLKDEVGWEVQVEEIDGAYVITQTIRGIRNPGIDDNVVFNQIREVIDRGNAVKEEDVYRITATDPNGTKQRLHLGEITALGHLQLYGTKVLLGSQAVNAYENFLYGLTTLINLGYQIEGLPTFKQVSSNTTMANLRMHYTNQMIDARLGNKVIWGNATLSSLKKAQRKSLYALERLIEESTGTVSERGMQGVTDMFRKDGSIRMVAVVEALLDNLIKSVTGEAPLTKGARRQTVKVRKFVADLETGKVTEGKAKKISQYEIGDYVIEETPGSFRIRQKGKLLAELPKTVVPTRNLFNTVDGQRVQMPPNVPKAVQQAYEKSVVLQAMPDSELISTLVSLYGLQDHSLSTSVSDTTEVVEETRTKYREPDLTPEQAAVFRGHRQQTATLADASATLDETTELDFTERTRSRHDDEASLDEPFKMRVKRPQVDKQASQVNPFFRRLFPNHERLNQATPTGDFQVGNLTTGWKIDITKAVEKVLSQVNIKEKIIIFDEQSAGAVLTNLRKMANDESLSDDTRQLASDYAEAIYQKQKTGLNNGAWVWAPFKSKSGGLISPSHRAIFIYSPKKTKGSGGSRGWQLAHELGHITQYVYVNAMSKDLQTELYSGLNDGIEYDQQRELYANFMAAEILRTNPELNTTETKLSEALIKIRDAVEKVYNWAKETFGVSGLPKAHQTFYGWMQALNTHVQGKVLSDQELSRLTPLAQAFYKDLQAQNAGPIIRKSVIHIDTQTDNFPSSKKSPLDQLTEAVNGINDVYYDDSFEGFSSRERLEVLKNPTPNQLRKWAAKRWGAQNMNAGVLRWFSDMDDNFYIWDAGQATHHHLWREGMKVTDHILAKGFADLDENTSVREMIDIMETPVGSDPFIDPMDGFDAMEGTAEERSGDPVFRSYWEDFQNFGKRFVDHPLDALKSVVWTADGELRSMGGFGLWLAREFHVRPGELGVDPNTIMRQIMQHGAKHHADLHALLNDIPGSRTSLAENAARRLRKGKQVDKTQEQKDRHEIMLALQLGTPKEEIRADLWPHVEAVRKYLDGIYNWFKHDMGLELKYIQGYYPLMLDAIIMESRREEFVEILVREGNFTIEEANEVRARITRDSNGGLNLGYQEEISEDFEFQGPGASFKRHRASDYRERKGRAKKVGEPQGNWNEDVRRALVEAGFYQQDMATTLIAYTDMVVRRAVWEKNYNAKNLDAVTEKEYERLGINPDAPIAALQFKIAQALDRGEINQTQYNRIVNDILPAYAGQLGLRINSKVRRLNAALVIYQNIRLLGFAVLSSIVDIGTTFTRGDMDSAFAAIRAMADKNTRAELRTALQELGALRLDLTEHVLNDQALNTFMTGNAKRINDLFFRYNQMEGWTNLMRAMAFASGRRFIMRHAKKAQAGNETSQKYMDELGIDVDKAADWTGEISGASENLKAGLNRWIDESMIRPDATIRPVWMSDPGYAVFSHLKGFLYGFQATFLQRVFKDAYPNFKMALSDPKKVGLLVHQNILPLLMLGMLALPFAALGYELRRLIAHGGKPTTGPEGFAYFKELVERSGMPGAFQMVVDMEQADQYGKPFLVGVAGPSVEHLYDTLTRNLDFTISRSIPIVAQSPPLQRWVRDFVPP